MRAAALYSEGISCEDAEFYSSQGKQGDVGDFPGLSVFPGGAAGDEGALSGAGEGQHRRGGQEGAHDMGAATGAGPAAGKGHQLQGHQLQLGGVR